MGVLDRISVKGFKSIRSAELEIRPINVLIGANGSGKSNLLEAMAFLHAIRAGNLQGYVGRAGGADRLLHFGAKTTDEMAFRARFSNEGICEYRLNLTPTATDALHPNSEALVYWDKEIYPDESRKKVISGEGGEAGISKASVGRESLAGKHVRRSVDSWRVYHFHDTGPHSPMKKTAALNDNRYLRPGWIQSRGGFVSFARKARMGLRLYPTNRAKRRAVLGGFCARAAGSEWGHDTLEVEACRR